MTSFTDEQLEMIADDTLGVYRASTLARELLQLRQQITPQAGEAVAWASAKEFAMLANGNTAMVSARRTLSGDVPLYRPAPPRPVCDGNHAAPACADPECWQRPSPVAPTANKPGDSSMIGVHYQFGGKARISMECSLKSVLIFCARQWAHYNDKQAPCCWDDIAMLLGEPSPPDSPGATGGS